MLHLFFAKVQTILEGQAGGMVSCLRKEKNRGNGDGEKKMDAQAAFGVGTTWFGTTRIGTTSYIVEADLSANLRWLAGRVGEMQLVLFETPEASNIPTPAEVRELARAARDADMAFTVHLPTGIEIGDPDPAVRNASCDLFRRVAGLTAPLSPLCWVFHAFGAPDPAVDRRERARENLARLIGEFASPRDLAIENIHRSFDPEAALVEEFDTSVCIDVGHLVCRGQDVEEHLRQWLPRCRSVHLHGTDARGRDHAPLDLLPPGFLARLPARLSSAPDLKTVTLEVFGREDFERSMRAMETAMRLL